MSDSKKVAAKASSKNFAIVRVLKLKTYGNISASHNHNHRLKETPNADPTQTHRNVHLIDCDDSVKRAHELHEFVDGTIRRDAVKANEYLFSASPEFFEGMSDEEVLTWAKHSLEFVEKRHTVEGIGSTVVSADLHFDETTPHLHISVVPLHKDKNGKIKLSAKHYFNEDRSKNAKPENKKLTALQDDYANHVKEFGLERGVRKSKAKHVSIRKFYGLIEKATSSLEEAKEKIAEGLQEFKDRGLNWLEDAGNSNNPFKLKKQIAEGKKIVKMKDAQIDKLSDLYLKRLEENMAFQDELAFSRGKNKVSDEDFENLTNETIQNALDRSKASAKKMAQYGVEKRDEMLMHAEVERDDIYEKAKQEGYDAGIAESLEKKRLLDASIQMQQEILDNKMKVIHQAEQAYNHEQRKAVQRAYRADRDFDYSPSP